MYKHNGRELPFYVHFTKCWKKRTKRYWKRQLSKKRRRAWKDDHERGLAQLESKVNWRDW